MTGAILGAGDTEVSKSGRNACLHEVGILLQEMASSQINMGHDVR